MVLMVTVMILMTTVVITKMIIIMMILRSGLGVVVVMLSSSLELTDNTTCQLLHSSPNLQFYGVNLTNLAVNTSLGRTALSRLSPEIISERFVSSQERMSTMIASHKSDILR